MQRRIADGCHLNRDTAAAIARADFEIAEIECFDMPAGHRLIRPAIQGSAVKGPARPPPEVAAPTPQAPP